MWIHCFVHLQLYKNNELYHQEYINKHNQTKIFTNVHQYANSQGKREIELFAAELQNLETNRNQRVQARLGREEL